MEILKSYCVHISTIFHFLFQYLFVLMVIARMSQHVGVGVGVADGGFGLTLRVCGTIHCNLGFKNLQSVCKRWSFVKIKG